MIQNAYVGLGSNLGDRAGYLLLALRGMLDAGLDVIRLSNIYETEPVEYKNQPPFLNMVAELRGSMLPSSEPPPADPLGYLCVDRFIASLTGARALRTAFELGLIDHLLQAEPA